MNETLLEILGIIFDSIYVYRLFETSLKFFIKGEKSSLKRSFAVFTLFWGLAEVILLIYNFIVRPLEGYVYSYYETATFHPESYRTALFFGYLGLSQLIFIIGRGIPDKRYLSSLAIIPLLPTIGAIFLPLEHLRMIGYIAAGASLIFPLLYLYIAITTSGIIRKKALIIFTGALLLFAGKTLTSKMLLLIFPEIAVIITYIIAPVLMLSGFILIDYGYS